MNKKINVLYKRITKRFSQNGYINLNHRPVNTKNDLVEICSIFRNPEYETFRIVYVKDKKIAGYESISSRCPSCVPLFCCRPKDKQNYEKCYYKMRDRMKRLNADGYYMVHNHPSGNTHISTPDIHATKHFIDHLEGFKGHLILGFDTYSWISDIDDKSGKVHIYNSVPINFKKADKMSKMMNKKSIYDVKINSRDDLVSVMQNIIHTKDYSTAILTDARNKIRMILDIPNSILNQDTKQLNNYFKNLARENGVEKVFFGTDDVKTFYKSMEHLDFGTFKDSICFKEISKNKIAICESADNIQKKNLFYDEEEPTPSVACTSFNISDNDLNFNDERKIKMDFENIKNTDYIKIPSNSLQKEKFLSKEDTFEPNEHQIKILLKRVGKAPIVKVIENTLEDKQSLVGGLIEVVPYLDDTLLICNEEGKITNLEPNVAFEYDYIAGDCFVIGDNYENGDFKSLTPEEIDKSKYDLSRRSFIPQKKSNWGVEELSDHTQRNLFLCVC